MIMLACCVNEATQHNYRTYLQRLRANRKELSKLSLDELYLARHSKKPIAVSES